MVPRYRYQVADFATGQFLEELPFDVRSFGQAINAGQTATATLPLTDLGSLDWRSLTEERRTLLVALRDNVIAWVGVIMKRRTPDSGVTEEFSAETLESYWAHRRIKSALTYTAADTFDIVRGIVTYAQALTGGNIRMQVSSNTAGYTQTISYVGTDRTRVLDAWTALAQVSPGFEFTVTWSSATSGGVTTFTPTLQLATSGLATTLDPILLQFPGNLSAYDYPEDGTARPNALTGIGADTGAGAIQNEQVDNADLAAGYPLYEDEVSLTDEKDATRLASRTAAALAAKGTDYVVPTATLRGDADPGFGSFPLGCPAQLLATSNAHPADPNGAAGLNVTRRITGWTVTPAPQESVALTLSGATGYILPAPKARDQAARLRDIEQRLRRIEVR